MKQLLFAILFSSIFLARSQAELAVSCSTNDASFKDIQDALGINAYYFTVYRPSLTNGVSIYFETKSVGQSNNVVFQLRADFDKLNSLKTGKDIPVLVIVNPGGSLDGEDIISAKKLHLFVRIAGISSSTVADNPFHNSQGGVSNWVPLAARESAGVFKLMSGHNSLSVAGPETELTVGFYQW